MDIISRAIEKEIGEAASQYPVVTLTGPRQAGKTTLLKYMFPDYTYISLEDKDHYQFAKDDPKAFLKKYTSQVILDEAQRVPEIFSYIQTKVDEDKIMGQYILSGSQNFLLMETITQSLAGRVAICKLLPLSLSELNKKSGHFEVLFKGGYPPVHHRGVDPIKWASDYIETYIQKGVTKMKNVTNLSTFRRLLSLLAARNGQVLNLSDLGRDCGVSYQTIKGWISILEASYIVFQLPCYSTNISKRIVRSPKVYFYDTALVLSLLNIKEEKDIYTHPSKGALFETLIISECIKWHLNRRRPFNGFFFRDQRGHEIDLVLEREIGKTLDIIELKSSTTIKSEFFKGLLHFQKTYPQFQLNPYVIYGGNEAQERTFGNVLPWSSGIQDILR